MQDIMTPAGHDVVESHFRPSRLIRRVANKFATSWITAACDARRAAAFALLLCAVSPVAAQTATRDPLVQPFASDSVWNMPIGSGAQYVPINMAPNPSGSIWTPMPQIDDEYLFLDANAPLTNINLSSAAWSGANRCGATGGLLVQVPFAANYLIPN